MFGFCVRGGWEGGVPAASTGCMPLLRRDHRSYGCGEPMEFLFSAFILQDQTQVLLHHLHQITRPPLRHTHTYIIGFLLCISRDFIFLLSVYIHDTGVWFWIIWHHFWIHVYYFYCKIVSLHATVMMFILL